MAARQSQAQDTTTPADPEEELTSLARLRRTVKRPTASRAAKVAYDAARTNWCERRPDRLARIIRRCETRARRAADLDVRDGWRLRAELLTDRWEHLAGSAWPTPRFEPWTLRGTTTILVEQPDRWRWARWMVDGVPCCAVESEARASATDYMPWYTWVLDGPPGRQARFLGTFPSLNAARHATGAPLPHYDWTWPNPDWPAAPFRAGSPPRCTPTSAGSLP